MKYLKILAAIGGILAGWVVGQKVAEPSEEQARISLIEKALPKTVMIQVDSVVEEMVLDAFGLHKSTRTATLIGAGVIVSPDGYVLTCHHLFNHGDVREIRIETENGISQVVKLLKFNEHNDLALLKLEGTYKKYFAKLAQPYGQKVGQSTIAIGYPFGNPWTVTHGMISALNNDEFAYNCIQSDTFINPGNSGGPLFDSDGHLVGINKILVSNGNPPTFSGIGIATSINQITEFLVKHRVNFQR